MARDFLNKNEFLFSGDRKISLDTPPNFSNFIPAWAQKAQGGLKIQSPP